MKGIVHTQQSSERESFGVRFLCGTYGTCPGAACEKAGRGLWRYRRNGENSLKYMEGKLFNLLLAVNQGGTAERRLVPRMSRDSEARFFM